MRLFYDNQPSNQQCKRASTVPQFCGCLSWWAKRFILTWYICVLVIALLPLSPSLYWKEVTENSYFPLVQSWTLPKESPGVTLRGWKQQ